MGTIVDVSSDETTAYAANIKDTALNQFQSALNQIFNRKQNALTANTTIATINGNDLKFGGSMTISSGVPFLYSLQVSNITEGNITDADIVNQLIAIRSGFTNTGWLVVEDERSGGCYQAEITNVGSTFKMEVYSDSVTYYIEGDPSNSYTASLGGAVEKLPSFSLELGSLPSSGTNIYILVKEKIDKIRNNGHIGDMILYDYGGKYIGTISQSGRTGWQMEVRLLNEIITIDYLPDGDVYNITRESAKTEKKTTIETSLPSSGTAVTLGKYYRIASISAARAITLPAMTDTTNIQTVVVFATIDSSYTASTPAITFTSTAVSGGSAPTVYYSDGYEVAGGNTYEINALWNGLYWVVASVKVAAAS